MEHLKAKKKISHGNYGGKIRGLLYRAMSSNRNSSRTSEGDNGTDGGESIKF